MKSVLRKTQTNQVKPLLRYPKNKKNKLKPRITVFRKKPKKPKEAKEDNRFFGKLRKTKKTEKPLKTRFEKPRKPDLNFHM